MHIVHLTQKPPSRGKLGFSSRGARRAGFTIFEVVVSLLVLGISMSAILACYSQAAIRTNWSAHSLAAQAMALSGIEQCRAAKYDPRGTTPVDELVSTNFPSKYDILDVGGSGSRTYGTNFVTITTVSANPPMKMVRVDCVWLYPGKGLFTNTVYTYRASNQ